MVIPLLLAGVARAADPVAAGTLVQIEAVARKDAFYDNRAGLLGLACRVGEAGLNSSGGRWMGGPLACGDGQEYYFYRVAVRVLPESVAGLFASTTEGAAADATVATASDPRQVNDEAAQTEWRPGTWGTITAISDEDAYASQRDELRGLRCRVADRPLETTGEGWWSGEVACGDRALFFYQVALTPEARFVVDMTWPAGTLVKVAAVEETDAHHAARARLEGRTCSVIHTALVPTGPTTFGGRLFCDDGSTWQVFRVRLTTPEASPPAR